MQLVLIAGLACFVPLPALAAKELDVSIAWGIAVSCAVVSAVGAWLLSRLLTRLRTRLTHEAFLNLPHPVLITDSKGAGVLANPAWRSIVGSRADGIRALEGEFAAASSRTSLDAIENAVREGETEIRELVRRDRQNNRTHWQASVAPLWGRGYVVVMLTEDTGRDALTDAILAEQALLEQLFNGFAVGFFSVDATGRFVSVNPVFANWLGRPAQELIADGARLSDFIDTEDGVPPWSTGGGEVSLRAGDGSVFQALVSESAVGDDESFRTRTVVRNLYAEDADKGRIEQLSTFFERFIESAPLGVLLLDGQEQVKHSSREFVDMVASAGAAISGRDLKEFFIKEDEAAIGTWIGNTLAGEETQPLALTVAREGGGSVTLIGSRLDDNSADILFLAKPFTLQQLAAKVKDALEHERVPGAAAE